MSLAKLVLIGLGLYAGYRVLKFVGELVYNWACEALARFGSRTGVVAVLSSAAGYVAKAIARFRGRAEVIDTIEVDEADLPEDVREALYRSGTVYQNVSV